MMREVACFRMTAEYRRLNGSRVVGRASPLAPNIDCTFRHAGVGGESAFGRKGLRRGGGGCWLEGMLRAAGAHPGYGKWRE